jgi:rhodanese-related sulfurtransferase
MKTICKVLFLLVFASVVFSCSSRQDFKNADEMVNAAMKTVKLITPEELNALMNGTGEEVYTLIDVRQEIEHYYGYIPGSVVLPRGSLEFSIGDDKFWEETGLYKPEKTDKIIVYCKKGQRGILAAETLARLGYTQVFALEGGYKKWELTYPDLYEKDLDKLGGGKSSSHGTSGGC